MAELILQKQHISHANVKAGDDWGSFCSLLCKYSRVECESMQQPSQSHTENNYLNLLLLKEVVEALSFSQDSCRNSSFIGLKLVYDFAF